MFKRLLSTALVFGLAAAAPPVFAQTNCAPRDMIVQHLADRYGEVLLSAGVQSEKQVVEVWSQPDGDTWTILVTQADGIACIVASGRHWFDSIPVEMPMGLVL